MNADDTDSGGRQDAPGNTRTRQKTRPGLFTSLIFVVILTYPYRDLRSAVSTIESASVECCERGRSSIGQSRGLIIPHKRNTGFGHGQTTRKNPGSHSFRRGAANRVGRENGYTFSR